MTLFRPNPKFDAQMRKTPEYRKGLGQIAQQVADEARNAAPKGGSGHYARSIDVYDDGQELGVATTDPAGHLIEFGSVNNPPYAPLRRGVRAAGLRLEDQGK